MSTHSWLPPFPHSLPRDKARKNIIRMLAELNFAEEESYNRIVALASRVFKVRKHDPYDLNILFLFVLIVFLFTDSDIRISLIG